MTLEQAKLIADHPNLAAFNEVEIRAALERLQSPRVVARIRNADGRAVERHAMRVDRLQNEIETIRNQDEARLV